MKQDAATLARRVKAVIRKLGITQAQAAEQARVAIWQLKRFLRGAYKRYPSGDFLASIMAWVEFHRDLLRTGNPVITRLWAGPNTARVNRMADLTYRWRLRSWTRWGKRT